MTGEAHKRAVLKILDRLPGAKTKGFFADLRAALREDGDPEGDAPDDIRTGCFAATVAVRQVSDAARAGAGQLAASSPAAIRRERPRRAPP
jgi:hypothetical protein